MLIPTPIKFNIKDKSRNFTYVVIAEVAPMKMFHIYNSNDYKYHGEDIKTDDDDDNNTVLVIIIVVIVLLVLIILIVTILILKKVRKKDSENINFQMKDKSLGKGMSLEEK